MDKRNIPLYIRSGMASVVLMLVMLVSHLPASAQTRFFNLTADEVKIDSLLPYFGYSKSLDDNHADSVYSVEIVYPEFFDMSPADIEAYKLISDESGNECDNGAQEGIPESGFHADSLS